MASVRAKLNLRAFALRPRCGAHCRTTGQPCRNPVVAGRDRCRLHGGSVGRGDNWHKPAWPDRNAPNATVKLNRKLADLQRAADKREKRLAAMTANERTEYERWKRDHQPTSIADRKRKRALRDQNAWARGSVEQQASAPPKPKTPELLELEQKLAELRNELELRRAFNEGVFS